jgi:hypothetical protein
MAAVINTHLRSLRRRNCIKTSPSRAVATFIMILLASLAIADQSIAVPLEYNPYASIGLIASFTKLGGRFGFAQDNGDVGTLNDVISDLGLPSSNMTWGLEVTARPLEHHLVRIFGFLPEDYKGGQTLNRTLVTRNFTYAPGTAITSEFQTSLFGFGYDLDFLVGPRWYGGLQGDLRYIRLLLRMGTAASGNEDTLSIDEMVPCIGAHFQTRNNFEFGRGLGIMNLGGFVRMNYSMTPNYLSYVDITAGLCVGFRFCGVASVDSKIGYHYESFYHDQELNTGKILELRRDGIMFSLEGLF